MSDVLNCMKWSTNGKQRELLKIDNNAVLVVTVFVFNIRKQKHRIIEGKGLVRVAHIVVWLLEMASKNIHVECQSHIFM